MSAETASPEQPVGRDWRLTMSMGLTLVWLAMGVLYISGVVGWPTFVQQQAPEMGSFL
ncbi:MAG: hypothetical protein JRG95_25045, partial [Deltaproteobacteria bacterium]|nr:hypothetical protein [Deltaproteobacteria bacterium]